MHSREQYLDAARGVPARRRERKESAAERSAPAHAPEPQGPDPEAVASGQGGAVASETGRELRGGGGERAGPVLGAVRFRLWAATVNGHRVWFLIQDPNSVRMINAGAGSMDFTCGKQPPRPVEIEYIDRPDSETKTVGLIKGINFK